MHEFALMNGLMKQIYTIMSEHNATRVKSVRVRLGALAHISPDHFREHFAESSRGGPAEYAELFIQVDTNPHDPLAQEILLESIDVENGEGV